MYEQNYRASQQYHKQNSTLWQLHKLTKISKNLASSLRLEVRALQFEDGRVLGFLTVRVKGVYGAMRQAIRDVHCTMETLDYDEKKYPTGRWHDGVHTSWVQEWTTTHISKLIYQAHKAQDQIINTLEMIRESREWLILRDWEHLESKMEYSIGTLMQIWQLLRYEYPEGANKMNDILN